MTREEYIIGDYVVAQNSISGKSRGVIIGIERSTGERKELLYTVRDYHYPRNGYPDKSFFGTQIKKRKPLRRCYWHGGDAWILGGNKRDGYCLLIGGHTLLDALMAKELVDYDQPLGAFEDFIVFAEYEEIW